MCFSLSKSVSPLRGTAKAFLLQRRRCGYILLWIIAAPEVIKMEMESLRHPFPAIYAPDSRILILGSFPSVKSREQMFFYGHPQNRFWRVMAALLSADVPQTVEEKRAFL